MSSMFPPSSSSSSSQKGVKLNAEGAPGPAVRVVTSLLCNLLRVTVTDGRVFVGIFAGTDQPLNILLDDTEEYRMTVPEASGSMLSESEPKAVELKKEARIDRRTRRYVGQVLIPWRMVNKIEAYKAQSRLGRRV
ncbi:hypothetical protein BDN72DRAFT_848782 [Pluteus cervinus]|uniref:Uncharacterized protein n=1 Tax=Pluteus cervinus TaxID=181527 RepID=A0ACD3A921_9AGAR|nr:hypothetical protein BDN72DRAFT_848782 [Pluteus cervinus]